MCLRKREDVFSDVVRSCELAGSQRRMPAHVVMLLQCFDLFGAARVPARCASSALPQQNILIIMLGANSSLCINFEMVAAPFHT